ncbi:MAG: GntR family transcriptional regulator [Desertimonas sp.]
MDATVTLNRLSPVPLYHQLADQLRQAISAGALPKGTYLGNEIVLAERWQVSRPTVRRAIQDLVEEGLLVRRRGIGTQVVNDQVRRPFSLSSLHEDLAASGRTPTTTVLSLAAAGAGDEVAGELGIAPGDEVIEIVRIRAAGSRPLALLHNWLLRDVADELTAEQLQAEGLYALLRAGGVRPHYAQQRLGAKIADAEEASLLGVERGAPLVTMRRVMQDDTGRVVEVGDHVYDAEHYSIEMSVVES